MKFLQQLLHTKAPSSARLLDIAILLSIIPHIFVMKFFMILYIGIALFFILKKESSNYDTYILFVSGAVLISLSFFNEYNFSNFSRMQFFVSLVSSLLIYAVMLQRVTKEVNIYLKFSPAFFMLLSFFFFESISMLFYAIFVVFVFALLNIWSRMNVALIDVIKLTLQLFILSLPVVVILFLVFPRIAFQKTDFGFKADTYAVSGYNGEMSVSSDEVKLSNKNVMEVYFQDQNISDDKLYFRGATLYEQNGLDWKKLPLGTQKDILIEEKDLIKYDITLYPHGKEWIYALDVPTKELEKTKLNADFTLHAKKPILSKTRYTLHSALSYRLISNDVSHALDVNVEENEQTYKSLEYLKNSDLNDMSKARELMKFFAKQKIEYSLNPKNIDLNDFTDSFLFSAKNGYCIHFASAFAISARTIGIPSRVVTGFKPNKKNMIDKYLLVKASDAHAWVELYIAEIGWTRFDPTTTASKSIGEREEIQTNSKKTIFEVINLNFMYVKYFIESWILDYNRLKQLSILKNLLNDTLYLMKFVLSILGVFLISFLLYVAIKKPRCKDNILCEMYELMKSLERYKLIKKESESMESFLLRVEEKTKLPTLDLSTAYHRAKYSKNSTAVDLKLLQDEIKNFKSNLFQLDT